MKWSLKYGTRGRKSAKYQCMSKECCKGKRKLFEQKCFQICRTLYFLNGKKCVEFYAKLFLSK